jgi:hypothetical protein
MWEVQNGNGGGANPTITVNGQTSNIEVGANFKETVIGSARQYGLGKFRLYINDVETLPANAPPTVEAGHQIRLVPFDVAG